MILGVRRLRGDALSGGLEVERGDGRASRDIQGSINGYKRCSAQQIGRPTETVKREPL